MKDYEKHILEDIETNEHKKSLCGEYIGFDFAFQSIDHAFFNSKNESRLIPCKACVNIVIEEFNKWK